MRGRSSIVVTLSRLRVALLSYAVLALLAVIFLSDRRFVIAVLAVLAGLAVMSITAYLRERYDRKN